MAGTEEADELAPGVVCSLTMLANRLVATPGEPNKFLLKVWGVDMLGPAGFPVGVEVISNV